MHSQSHGHSHHHHASTRIGWAFILNLVFTIIEFIGGWLTNSTAIMADAVHDLGDSFSIGSAWFLSRLSDKAADEMYTYGYRRFSLFGALLNGVVLFVGSAWVLTEAIPRLFAPVMPEATGMLVLAILGIAVNGYAALKLSHGKSLNEKVLNWHLMEDVLGWLAVLIVSVTLHFVDWPVLDPLLSIVFTLFILLNVSRTLWQTSRLFFQAAPDRDMKQRILEDLLAIDEVQDVHFLHFWSLDGEHHVLTAHLNIDRPVDQADFPGLKNKVSDALEDYELAHTTIELEFPEEQCRDNR